MITTLIVLVAICILSLGFILVIPSFCSDKSIHALFAGRYPGSSKGPS